MAVIGTRNFSRMRGNAELVLGADPESVAWFRYGASYVLTLLQMVEFYVSLDRKEEAEDIMIDLRERLAGADEAATVAKNMLRIGIYLDEAEHLQSQQRDQLDSVLGVVKKDGGQ
jgi:hypothetical protein